METDNDDNGYYNFLVCQDIKSEFIILLCLWHNIWSHFICYNFNIYGWKINTTGSYFNTIILVFSMIIDKICCIYYFCYISIIKGKAMYVIFAASMSLYIAKTLWENMQLIIMQYREWAMWYVLVTSLISFVICYRFGPVTNPRTKQIIQWFLQVSCM